MFKKKKGKGKGGSVMEKDSPVAAVLSSMHGRKKPKGSRTSTKHFKEMGGY